MAEEEDLSELIEGVARHLQIAGVAGLPREWFALKACPAPVESGNILAQGKEETDLEQTTIFGETNFKAVAGAPAGVPPAAVAGPYDDLDIAAVEQLAKECRKCRLCDERNKVVFGVGNTNRPDIVFVGEGPGADEDRIGEPFVGRAGALLTAAITKGMGLQRSDVYICNVVKCRPPGNRTPLPDEVASCTPYLYRQLELLSPKVIVTLGQPAQLALSGVNMGITRLRGRWLDWRGIKLMPTFHPAYILRNPAVKKEFWEDLQAVMAEVGLKPRAR